VKELSEQHNDEVSSLNYLKIAIVRTMFQDEGSSIMAYPVKAVANAILEIAEKHNSELTPLKLQKLVYISHGWHLAIKDTVLVEDEYAEAWQYGPVFPSIYHEFKGAGKGSIQKRASEIELTDGPNFHIDVIEPTIPVTDEFTWSLLNKVWDSYGKYSGLTLSDVTHRKGTPWQTTWEGSGHRKNADISNDIIKTHYKHLATSRQNEAS
jgi:uncharacterized phage-associated protein